MKRILAAFFLVILAHGTLWAQEIELGTTQWEDATFTEDVPFFGSKNIEFRHQVTNQFAKAKFFWDTSEIILKEEQFHETYTALDTDTLVDIEYFKETLLWRYNHSNMDLALGTEIFRLKDNQASYALSEEHTSTRFQLTTLELKVEQNQEWFSIGKRHHLRNRLEAGQTYSQKLYEEYYLAWGLYSKGQAQFRMERIERMGIYPESNLENEKDLVMAYVDKRPEEPNLEAYWKQYRIELGARQIAEVTQYWLDYVNEGVFFIGDTQNVISYGLHAKSHPIQYLYDETLDEWIESQEEANGFTHSFSFSGYAPIVNSPVQLNWDLRYEEFPLLSSERHQKLELVLSGRF